MIKNSINLNLITEFLTSVDREAGLPLDKPRSNVYSPARRQANYPIPVSITNKNSSDVLMAAVLGTLFRYGSYSPVIGRASFDTLDSALPIYNLIALEINPDDTPLTLLRKVQTNLESAATSAVKEINKLIDLVDEKSARNTNPLFRVCLADESSVKNVQGLKTDIILIPVPEKQELIIDCNDRLFSSKLVDRFFFHLSEVWKWVVSEQLTAIKSISILTGEEREKFNSFRSVIDTNFEFHPVYELFQKQAAKTPHQTCLIDGNVDYSFLELEKRSNQIANYLAAQGIRRGQHVGICLHPGSDQILSLLGVLKTGAAVVPIDYSLPDSRLHRVFERCLPDLTILHTPTLKIKELIKSKSVNLSSDKELIFKHSDQPLMVEVKDSDSIYVLFTSGSTGYPKGVSMTQVGLSNLIQWQRERSLVPNAKTLQRTSLAFDVGFQEILSTLVAGGCLVIASEEERSDIASLPSKIEAYQIERLFLPPSRCAVTTWVSVGPY